MKTEYKKILEGYSEKESERIICPVCNYKYSKYLFDCPKCAEERMKDEN